MEAAPPEVGWFYPDIDEIGRPQNFTTGGDFSLLMLLAENFCDAGSLMRREVVDRGPAHQPRVPGGRTWIFWLGRGRTRLRRPALARRGFLYRRRPKACCRSPSAGARRCWRVARRHARLLRPQRLLELDAAEAPRYALFSPERPGMRLLLDPRGSGGEP
jgi:hypothetical protein